MKHIYNLIFFMCISLSISAQISINKNSLPYVGATLKTYTNINPDVDLSGTEGPITWDFSSLSTTLLNEVKLEDPSEGSASVSEADFVIKTTDFVERYYKNSNDFIEEIYLITLDPVFNSFEIQNSYAQNPIYRKGSIEYEQSYASESRFEAPLAWDDLPDTITSGIGLQFDSVRFNTNWNRTDDITAYGEVILPDATWPALKEETEIIRFVTIDVFFLGAWIEAPAQLLEAFLGDFADLLQPDTTHTVNFYSNQSIEILASFQMDEDNLEPTTVEYKAGPEITTDTYETQLNHITEVSIYPNPSFGNVSFQFKHCVPGTYKIQIFNVLGEKIWNSSYNLKPNNKPFQTDLSQLSKGTYLYTVYGPQGNKITTKRLVIINP